MTDITEATRNAAKIGAEIICKRNNITDPLDRARVNSILTMRLSMDKYLKQPANKVLQDLEDELRSETEDE